MPERWSRAAAWPPKPLYMNQERCERCDLPLSGCPHGGSDQVVWATPYGDWYHARPDCPGIRDGHFLAEMYGRSVHRPERMRRSQAELKGLHRHECPPEDRWSAQA
jgi:hypothetical protein